MMAGQALLGIGLLPSNPLYVSAACALAFLIGAVSHVYPLVVRVLTCRAGIVFIGFGLLRLGLVIVNMLSMPVMSGYTSAVVILVALTQIGPIMGFPEESQTEGWRVIWSVLQSLPQARLNPSLFGFATVLVLFGARNFEMVDCSD
jgi:SulP family sulfate permease